MFIQQSLFFFFYFPSSIYYLHRFSLLRKNARLTGQQIGVGLYYTISYNRIIIRKLIFHMTQASIDFCSIYTVTIRIGPEP